MHGDSARFRQSGGNCSLFKENPPGGPPQKTKVPQSPLKIFPQSRKGRTSENPHHPQGYSGDKDFNSRPFRGI